VTTSTGIALRIDPVTESARIIDGLRSTIHGRFSKRGAVVGLSGGIDSSTVAHLCQRAFGAEHVLGILLPEKDSSPDSARLAQTVADQLGIRTLTVNITPSHDLLWCF
jgi:NAD+ synthase